MTAIAGHWWAVLAAIVLYLISKVTASVIGREVSGWLPHLSEWIIRSGASLLPVEERARWEEEQRADLAAYIDRPITGLLHAVDAWRTTRSLRHELPATDEVGQPSFLWFVVGWLPLVGVLLLYSLLHVRSSPAVSEFDLARRFDTFIGGGHLPTVWLQDHLSDGSQHLRLWDYASWAVIASHQFVTLVALAFLWRTAHEQFNRYVGMIVLLSCAGFAVTCFCPHHRRGAARTLLTCCR